MGTALTEREGRELKRVKSDYTRTEIADKLVLDRSFRKGWFELTLLLQPRVPVAGSNVFEID